MGLTLKDAFLAIYRLKKWVEELEGKVGKLEGELRELKENFVLIPRGGLRGALTEAELEELKREALAYLEKWPSVGKLRLAEDLVKRIPWLSKLVDRASSSWRVPPTYLVPELASILEELLAGEPNVEVTDYCFNLKR